MQLVPGLVGEVRLKPELSNSGKVHLISQNRRSLNGKIKTDIKNKKVLEGKERKDN